MRPTTYLGMTGIVITMMVTAGLWSYTPGTADAHCQIPCGIYDEQARIQQMHEDTTTIEKAIRRQNELAGESDAQSAQQFVRWTTNKEEHASRIIATISQYFLTQKIKPVAEGEDGREAYLRMLADHHAVMVAAMKAKQNADPAAADDLRAAIRNIEQYWLSEDGNDDHDHAHD